MPRHTEPAAQAVGVPGKTGRATLPQRIQNELYALAAGELGRRHEECTEHSTGQQAACWAAGIEVRTRCGLSEAEFAVRAKPHQIGMIGVGLAVDQYQVGPDMTVPVVLPLTAKRVVPMARRQRPVLRKIGHDMRQFGIDGPGETTSLFAPVVSFEGRGPPNRPHGDRQSGR